MVTISDSMLGGNGTAAAAYAYARSIEEDLGVRVKVAKYYYGGATSGHILEQLRSSVGTLRRDVRAADVIVFIVPLGGLKDMCPWDEATGVPAAGTPEEYRACGKAFAKRYGADAEAIAAEITGLRSPADALIRTTDFWEPFYRTFASMGLGETVHENFLGVNGALRQAMDAHGIPVIGAYEAFMGPDGSLDPIAAGFVEDDELHPTTKGTEVLGQLFRDLGYERASATPVP